MIKLMSVFYIIAAALCVAHAHKLPVLIPLAPVFLAAGVLCWLDYSNTDERKEN